MAHQDFSEAEKFYLDQIVEPEEAPGIGGDCSAALHCPTCSSASSFSRSNFQ